MATPYADPVTEDMMVDEAGTMAPDADATIVEEPPMSPEQVLSVLIGAPNIADGMRASEDGVTRLAEIAAKVCEEYEIDEHSREPWLKKNVEAMKLAMMVAEQKDYPFENAANIKYPLIATAALQFNARAYPAIVTPDRVVKCKVRGRDPEGTKAARADRVSEHMSDQLLNEMPEWEADTDRLLVILPIEGSVFRKAWYDPSLGRNVSRLVKADNFVVNYFARSIEDAPRKTEKLWLYPHEIAERILDGRFIEFEYENVTADDTSDADKVQGAENDQDAPHLFLEQHRLLDLDEDGYPEPYIVTVHKSTQKVCRIVANYSADTVRLTADGRISAIRPETYFVHYQFMPNPDGGFYGLGFGWLLGATNETINSTLNQMMDAGHMANMQGGLISSVLGVREKNIKLERGEWRVINTSLPLNQAMFPIKYDGPSDVLFKLLGLLIEGGKELASTKDVLTGNTPATAPVGTTLALIEQGLQVFTSIYKRVHRGLKFELAILARLNFQHLTPEEYSNFFDEEANPQEDYNSKDMDVLPISDPQSVTKMQKLAKAQLVLDVSKEDPMVNHGEALKRFFEAADVEDIEKLIVPPPEPDPAEEAFMQALKELGLQEQMAKITETMTKSLKNIADAEAAEEGQQLSLYDMFLRTLQAEHTMETGADGQGRVPGMEGQPDDAAGAPALPGPGVGGIGADPSGIAPAADPAVAGMGEPAGPSGLPQGAL